MRPDPRGHSSSKVSLTAPAASKSASAAHAVTSFPPCWLTLPTSRYTTKGGAEPNSSSNSRFAATNGSSPDSYSYSVSTKHHLLSAPRTRRPCAQAAPQGRSRRVAATVEQRTARAPAWACSASRFCLTGARSKRRQPSTLRLSASRGAR